jgi:hypothetical protein
MTSTSNPYILTIPSFPVDVKKDKRKRYIQQPDGLLDRTKTRENFQKTNNQTCTGGIITIASVLFSTPVGWVIGGIILPLLLPLAFYIIKAELETGLPFSQTELQARLIEEFANLPSGQKLPPITTLLLTFPISNPLISSETSKDNNWLRQGLFRLDYLIPWLVGFGLLAATPIYTNSNKIRTTIYKQQIIAASPIQAKHGETDIRRIKDKEYIQTKSVIKKVLLESLIAVLAIVNGVLNFMIGPYGIVWLIGHFRLLIALELNELRKFSHPSALDSFVNNLLPEDLKGIISVENKNVCTFFMYRVVEFLKKVALPEGAEIVVVSTKDI